MFECRAVFGREELSLISVGAINTLCFYWVGLLKSPCGLSNEKLGKVVNDTQQPSCEDQGRTTKERS